MKLKQTDGVYEFEQGDNLVGKVYYEPKDYGIEITQVWTNPEFRGQGLASIFMQKVVDLLIERQQKLSATCSYAIYWMEKHPEKKDYYL